MLLKPSTVLLRTFGVFCSYAVCNRQFPTPKTPPLDIVIRSPTAAATAGATSLPNLVVHTNLGPVQGYFANSLNGNLFRAFEGVPYAEPPVGELRFREPQPKKAWGTSIRSNRKYSCLQMNPLRFFQVMGDEDCLYLNIYVPRSQSKTNGTRTTLPVYIFIHGGAFFWGAGHLHGPTYMMDEEIILVTVNYRLGVLGFLSTGDGASYGNMGLKDQAMALAWIQENIGHFGGDSSRITIGGQSSGAVSAHLHMMSPLSQGNFAGVIAQSGSALAHWAVPPNQIELGHRLAESLHCDLPNTSAMVDCLRRKPGPRLVAAHQELFTWLQYPAVLFGPTVEGNRTGAFLPADPASLYAQGQVAKVPMVTGVVKDEGQLFSLVMYAIPLGTRLLLLQKYKALPSVLMYDEANESLTNSVIEFYHPRPTSTLDAITDPNAVWECLRDMGRMVTDRFYNVPLHKTLRLHSRHGEAPIYAYRFSYKGQHGAPDKARVPPGEWGVMHGDELQYLFNSSEFFPPIRRSHGSGNDDADVDDDSDYRMSKYLIKLWTSFIKTGKPNIPLKDQEQGRLSSEWTPYKNGPRTTTDPKTDFHGHEEEKCDGNRRLILEIKLDNAQIKPECSVYKYKSKIGVNFWKNMSLY